MSANNWATCPKCHQQAIKKREALEAHTENAYANVSEEEYLSLRKELTELPAPLKPTLREDYEIWMDEKGYFKVWYSCSCSECGFSFSFKHGKFAPEFGIAIHFLKGET